MIPTESSQSLTELAERCGGPTEFLRELTGATCTLIREFPDFVYAYDQSSQNLGAPCSYHRGPSYDREHCCGCLFGLALQLLGFRYTGPGDITRLVKTVFPEGFQYQDQVRVGLGVAQRLQDNGAPWRMCIIPIAEAKLPGGAGSRATSDYPRWDEVTEGLTNSRKCPLPFTRADFNVRSRDLLEALLSYAFGPIPEKLEA